MLKSFIMLLTNGFQVKEEVKSYASLNLDEEVQKLKRRNCFIKTRPKNIRDAIEKNVVYTRKKGRLISFKLG